MRRIPGRKCIDVDEADGIRQAVEHLVARGRKKIALLLAAESTPRHRSQRKRGFHKALDALEIAFRPERVVSEISGWGWDLPGTDQKVDKLVDRLVVRDGADAIIAYDDFCAAFLLQSFSRYGLQVPRDVALVGFENDMISHHLTPPLTTINIPVSDVAEAAIALLIGATQRSNRKRLSSQTFKPKLLARGTS